MSRFLFTAVLLLCLSPVGYAQSIVSNGIAKFDFFFSADDKKKKIKTNKIDYLVVKTKKNCGDCFNEIGNTISQNAEGKKRIYFVEFIKDNADPVWYIKDNKLRMPDAKKILFKKYASSESNVTIFDAARINITDISPILIIIKEGQLHIYSYKEMYDLNGMKKTFVQTLKK